MATLKENMEAIKLEKDTKILPENLKSGITAFGITGTYEGNGGSSEPSESYIPEKPIKLYSSVEELQADTDIVRDMIGLVYDYDGEPLKVGSVFSYLTFPETVVLPEAVTSVKTLTNSIENVDSSSDVYISTCKLAKTYFRFYMYTELMTLKVEYSSTDGITYTRTTNHFEKTDNNGLSYLYYTFKIVDTWDERFNYFMYAGSSALISLYAAKGDDNFDTPLTSEVKVENDEVIVRRKSYNHFVDRNKAMSLCRKILTTSHADLSSLNCSIFKQGDKWICGFVIYTGTYGDKMCYRLQNNVLTDGSIDNTSISSSRLSTSVTFKNVVLYELNFENQTYTSIDTSGYTTETKQISYTNNNGVVVDWKYYATNIPTNTMLLQVYVTESAWIDYIGPSELMTVDGITVYEPLLDAYQSGNGTYELAPTQLTLTDANKLAKGEIAYGNGQVIEGTFESTVTKYAPRHIIFNGYSGTELDAEIAALDTSNITDFGGMFCACKNLISLDLTSFNTDNVTSMISMFITCSALTSVNMSTFNTSKVTSMKTMFRNCTSLQTIDMSGFVFTAVTDHTDMFSGVPTNCTIYVKDQDTVTLLTSWDSTHTYTVKS